MLKYELPSNLETMLREEIIGKFLNEESFLDDKLVRDEATRQFYIMMEPWRREKNPRTFEYFERVVNVAVVRQSSDIVKWFQDTYMKAADKFF